MRISKKIKDLILNNKTFLITAHINMEADALGSCLAFSQLLKQLKKKSKVQMPERIPGIYDFLSVNLPKDNVALEDVDVFVVLDCPNLERVGNVKKTILKYNKPIINIDHHISNSVFGDANWIDAEASSTGEMIYDLFQSMKVKLTKPAAEAIYSAILTDTGFFHYGNTTSKSLTIASHLRKEVSHDEIAESLFGSFSYSRMRLLGKVLSSLEISKDGRVSWLEITDEMCKETKSEMSDTEGFIDYARGIDGVKVAICFKENPAPKYTKVSYRGRGVDVNYIAKHFGGGGHTAASGCEMELKLPVAKEKVIRFVKQLVAKQFKNK